MSSPPAAEKARLGDIIGRSIHDLRNPLSVVRASLEWLELELQGREELLDAVRDASTASARMLLILEDLATLARLESEEPVLRVALDLSAVIGRVISAANARLASRGVTVATNAAEPLELRGDARLLERAIEALVDACTRGATQGAIIDVEAAHRDEQGGDVELMVSLRGTPKADVRNASIEALASGGLGVYLALRIIERHGGSLVVVTTSTMPRTIVCLPQ